MNNEKHSVIEYTYYRAYSDALLWVLENAPSQREIRKKYEYHKGMVDSIIRKENKKREVQRTSLIFFICI